MEAPEGAQPYAPATLAVTAGRPPRGPDAPLNVALSFASTYVAGGERGYGRYGNATWTALEEAIGALDGGRALAFGSGVAAVAAVLAGVRPGGVVVVARHAYSGTHGLLDEAVAAGRLHEVRRVDVADTAVVRAAAVGADLVWVESPTNPALEVADVPAVLSAAREEGALAVFDGTFTTPLVLRGLDLGADVVVHSATKYLGGHSDALLGATVTRDHELGARLLLHRSRHGAIPGVAESWLVLRGLRTLALRVERSQANAAEIARRLVGHPAVLRVRYPGLPDDPGNGRASRQMRGFGSIVCLEPHGGVQAAEDLAAAVRLWVHATSLGGVESSLERRRRWAVEAPTVPEGLVRLSVGVEDVEDLWADLSAALTSAGARPSLPGT